MQHNMDLQLFHDATDSLIISNHIFEFTSKYLSEQEIITKISNWIKQDQSGFLINTLNNPSFRNGLISAFKCLIWQNNQTMDSYKLIINWFENNCDYKGVAPVQEDMQVW